MGGRRSEPSASEAAGLLWIATPGDIESLHGARERVLERIEAACRRARREPNEVTLVAVSKTVPAERIAAAIGAGFELFGENRVQEAAEKAPLLPRARWHLVGHLQGNKARAAIELFELVQSVDSLDLARRLDRLAGELKPGSRMPVLLQVNVDADPSKAGFSPAAVESGIAELAALPNLRIDGLMTVGRLVERPEEARPTFVALRRLSEQLRGIEPGLGAALSMGMTDDFEAAVEEGATIVRIGRAIFGDRPAG